MNFKNGAIAKHVANTIISECDRQAARERIKRLKTEGQSTRDRILAITKKMTAVKLVLEGGLFILDDAVYEQGERKKKEAIEAAAADRRKKDLELMIQSYHADKTIERMKTMDIKKWRSITLIKAYLRPLRQDGDPPMPTKRDEIEARFYAMSSRKRFHLIPEEDVMQKFQHWKRAHKGGHKKK